MKPKSLLLLFVAGTCGLVAALAITKQLAGIQPAALPPTPRESYKSVVIVTSNQEVGTQLTEEMLKKVELPEQGLPEGSFPNPAEIVGETLSVRVFKGEVILTGKLGGEKTLAFLMNNLPLGMRLATVQVVDEASRMQGLINPGCHVDVLWLPERLELQGISVITLLQNVSVMAVGQRIGMDESETPSGKDRKSTEQNYTLMVTPEQSLRLFAASNKGHIRLALRGKQDNSPLNQMDDENLDVQLGLKARPQEKVQPTPGSTSATQQEEVYEVVTVKRGEIIVETFNTLAKKRPPQK